MATPQLRHSNVYVDMDFDGDKREEAILRVTKAFDQAEAQGLINVYLDRDYDDNTYTIRGQVMETMAQAVMREAGEKRSRMTQEQREREQYEALKKKFGS